MSYLKHIILLILILFTTSLSGQVIESTYSNSVWQIPIFEFNRLLFVKAYVNNQRGTYMVDTGSNLLLLNKRYINKKYLTDSVISHSIEGSQIAHIIHVNFGWNVNQLRNSKCGVTDLRHIETVAGIHIDGIIGHSILSQYDCVFNHYRNYLRLFELYNTGNRINTVLDSEGITDVIVMFPNSFLPYMTGNIDIHYFKIALDTGASYTSLDTSVTKKLKHTYYEQYGYIRSVGILKNEKIKLISLGKTLFICDRSADTPCSSHK